MATAVSRDAYGQLVEQVRQSVRQHVPAGSTVLMVSKGDDALLALEEHHAWHFPRDEHGAYAGHHPGSSAEALAHLRYLFDEGARYVVFPATAAWWFEHYRELADHLDSAHTLTLSRDGVCVIYELGESAAFKAFADLDPDLAPPPVREPGAPTKYLTLARSSRRPTLRVLTILARFGVTQYPAAQQQIAALFTRQLPGVERDVIVVDTALPRTCVDQHDGVTLLGADNSSREFSAFDRGVEFAGPGIWSYDLVHFATSAFNTLYVAYLDRLEPRLLRAVRDRNACLGHIDCYNEPIDIFTYRAQHWIRSCFLFLPPVEVKALRTFVSVPRGDNLFTGDPANPFRSDAPLSPRYRGYITQWLTGGHIGQGTTWHSAFTLDHENVSAFEEKARSILNEQLLSIRLQALGCRLVDVTWLATALSRGDGVPWAASWREQLAARDRDAIVPAAKAPAVPAGAWV